MSAELCQPVFSVEQVYDVSKCIWVQGSIPNRPMDFSVMNFNLEYGKHTDHFRFQLTFKALPVVLFWCISKKNIHNI